MTQFIKAPFNFVPVSDKVYFPSWANQISHDIPFEDGESGELELTIRAHSPVFVRNGHFEKDREAKNDQYTSFSNQNGQYFIPATSIKGMIRNVMEILSFGKMKVDRKMQFATREWNKPEIYNLKGHQKSIYCGWLSLQNGNYIIQECKSKPYRINHIRLDEYFKENGINLKFRDYFSEDSKAEDTVTINDIKYDIKTAVAKYALLGSRVGILNNVGFSKDEEYAVKYQENRIKVNKSNPDMYGTIVFTGSPDRWEKERRPKSGKFYEFVFENDLKNSSLNLSKEQFDHFKFIYKDSEDWKYWQKKIELGESMPIFFRKREEGNQIQLEDFGLAFLYKTPFELSPFELLPESHRSPKEESRHYKPDLSECIFGFTGKYKSPEEKIGDTKKDSNNTYTEKQESLRGRIHFSHAFLQGKPDFEEEVKLVLSSPKASYYPIYVKQNGNNGIVSKYQVYEEGGSLAGWKRYPLRKSVSKGMVTDNSNIPSVLKPLKKDSIFKCIISFHNLKTAEIGALLSAITFHGKSDGYFHQIGQAKPFGYGKIRIDVSSYTSLKYNIDHYLATFEGEMVKDKDLFNNNLSWHCSEQVVALFTMAYDYDGATDRLLSYMTMDNEKSKNDFLNAKEFNEYLQNYTSLINQNKAPASYYQAYFEREQDAIARKEEEEKRLKEDNQKYELMLAREKEEELARLNKEAKAEKALKDGLIFLHPDINKRNSWDEFVKVVENYGRAYWQMSNFDTIVQKHPEGILPLPEHAKIIRVIEAFNETVNEKYGEAWRQPFDKNKYFKHFTKWIGKDKAFDLFTKTITKP